MVGGYMGKIAVIDLSDDSIEIIDFSDSDKRKYLGGYGYGAKYIYQNQKPKVAPLGEDNIFGVLAGPLTGTNFPAVSRFTVCGKSPLTDTWGDSNGGSNFGPTMKFSGFDGIFVKGISEKPKYIVLNNGKVEIKDAVSLWGKDTYEIEDIIKKTYGKKAESICIGPAGEKLSLISGIVTNKGKIAARSGMGALMGSKMLKAVVVMGDMKVEIADKEKYDIVRKKIQKQIKEGFGSSELLKEMGTPGIAHELLLNGDMPIKNWYGSVDEMKETGNFEYDHMNKYRVSKKTCYSCPVRCWGNSMVEKGKFALKEPVHMPEYEAIGAIGGYCLNSNYEVIMKVNDICNRSGLDVISTGAAISFAMNCYEKGIISKEDSDGMELIWGDDDIMVELAEKIAQSEGFGKLLAQGTRKASEQIGKGSEKYAIQVQGQELPAHDCKFKNATGMGLSYNIDPTPGRHTQWSYASKPQGFSEAFPDVKCDFGDYEFSGRAKAYRLYSSMYHSVSSMGTCLFGYCSTDIPTYPAAYAAVTGWDFDIHEFAKTGERIGDLRQMFTVREGLNPYNFEFPKIAQGVTPLKEGPLKGITIDIETMKKEFFEEMDWDTKTGMPSEARLRELELL